MRTKIIEAFESLLQEKDFASIDMRSIAAKAGIAVGTIYNYFPNKDSLVKEIITIKWESFKESLKNVEKINAPPEEKLAHLIFELATFLLHHRGIWQGLFLEEKDKDLKHWQTLAKTHNSIAIEEISKFLAKSLFPLTCSLDDAARMIWGITAAFASKNIDLEKTKLLANYLLKGIGGRES